MPNASVKLASEFGCTCACFGSGIDSQSVTYLCTSARVTHGVKTGLCQGIYGDLLALEGPLGAARGSVQRRMPPLELPAVESHSAGDAMLAHPWARNTALYGPIVSVREAVGSAMLSDSTPPRRTPYSSPLLRSQDGAGTPSNGCLTSLRWCRARSLPSNDLHVSSREKRPWLAEMAAYRPCQAAQ